MFCFRQHCQDVLKDQNGGSHQNICNFMVAGFHNTTLIIKE
ncbi:HopJ type III effector protein [Polaribacter litorisediminis]|nr:HopJ type III effector protein [Polaribacter litorisediminis]